jgi:hypothetical protein
MKILKSIKQLFCFHNYFWVEDWIDFDKEPSETKIYKCKKCGKTKKDTKLIGKTNKK